MTEANVKSEADLGQTVEQPQTLITQFNCEISHNKGSLIASQVSMRSQIFLKVFLEIEFQVSWNYSLVQY